MCLHLPLDFIPVGRARASAPGAPGVGGIAERLAAAAIDLLTYSCMRFDRPIGIHVIDTLEGMENLASEWLELWQSCPKATPFQAPQWLLPWTRHVFAGGQLRALAIRDVHKLVGFAPLFRWGIHRRTISFMGAGISDYGGLLFAPGWEAECASAVRRFLAEDDWDALDLQELRCGSGLLDGWPAEPCSVCPVLELSTFPGSMDHKYRTDMRRARNKLSKSADVQFATANETTLARCMDEFFRLHAA